MNQRLEDLEQRIADLEKKIHDQQKEINLLVHRSVRLELSPEQVVQNVLKDSDNLTFRANLKRRILFDRINEQKH